MFLAPLFFFFLVRLLLNLANIISGEIGFKLLSSLIFSFTPERAAALGSAELRVRFACGRGGSIVSLLCQGSFAQIPQQPSINLHRRFHSSSKQNRGSGAKLEK